MKASKIWHCNCCDGVIKPGEEFDMIQGSFFKKGHYKKNGETTAESSEKEGPA